MTAHDSDACTQDQRCRCLCRACDEYCGMWFTTADAAVAYARTVVGQYDVPVAVNETRTPDGHLYRATISSDGECLRIVRTAVDRP